LSRGLSKIAQIGFYRAVVRLDRVVPNGLGPRTAQTAPARPLENGIGWRHWRPPRRSATPKWTLPNRARGR